MYRSNSNRSKGNRSKCHCREWHSQTVAASMISSGSAGQGPGMGSRLYALAKPLNTSRNQHASEPYAEKVSAGMQKCRAAWIDGELTGSASLVTRDVVCLDETMENRTQTTSLTTICRECICRGSTYTESSTCETDCGAPSTPHAANWANNDF
jgi:hypothetical protein